MTATTVSAPEIQITTYSKQYSLELTDFANASISFGDQNDATAYNASKTLFETTLLCKIFGIEYKFTKDSSENITGIEMTYYSELKYKMMYATGNDEGDTKKCLFGIISNFVATGKTNVDDPYSTESTKPKVEIKSLDIEGPYFFLLAHKDATTGTNAKPEENILRVHKIVQCPNTQFVAADTAATKTMCGLFDTSKKSCIFGFFNTQISSAETDVFYMPYNSCCLEGRSREIINLPGPSYEGYFKVTKPFIGVVGY